MRDYIYIGCSPAEEKCVQVNDQHDYMPQMRKEVNVYKRQLERQFPKPDDVYGYLAVKTEHHDFGSYLEVVAYYDTDSQESFRWALNIEGNSPANWDDKARQELAS
jgi:S-adenosylmethionine:diacylglycerol 3-amino-3-carboxypropyl transferase